MAAMMTTCGSERDRLRDSMFRSRPGSVIDRVREVTDVGDLEVPGVLGIRHEVVVDAQRLGDALGHADARVVARLEDDDARGLACDLRCVREERRLDDP